MKSGIMEEGRFLETDKGVPQSGSISPVLANVYLHYALDMWFDKVVKRQCRGDAAMIRYADDAVFCFYCKSDALRFYAGLKERLAKFGLELSEDKTVIIPFGKEAGENAPPFDFLGFSFYGGRNRKGGFTVKLHTRKKMVDFYQYVKWQLLRTLKRRSKRDKTNWDKLNRIFEKFPLLRPKVSVNIWAG